MTIEVASIAIQEAAEGRYASPLIAGRFQILASVIGGTFFIVDHQKSDLVIRVAGPISDIRRFTKKDAEDWIKEFTSGVVQRIDKPRSYRAYKQGVETMSVTTEPKVLQPIMTAAKAAANKTNGKTKAPVPAKTKAPVIAKTKTPVVAKTKVPVAAKTKAPVTAKTKAPEKSGEARRGRGLSKEGTMSATIRSFILEGKHSDEEILKRSSQIHNKKLPSNAVAYYREKLQARGLLG